ncbi:hypothetical protein FACS1894110_26050 [Spirochaetia bacterium]|nr:hypothetical protein FACS1894110_26050 [Spirochaetia bacterium]
MTPAFLNKFLSLFHGRKDPETEKKKILKSLAKEFAGNKFSRFYKPKSGLVEPGLGAFFHEMYKTLSYVPTALQNAAQSDILREIIVESFLDAKYLDARQRLNADYVAQQVQTLSIAEVSALLQEDLDLLSSAFEGSLIADVDECYNQILALVQMASFDFFFFLKKFDPNLVEQNFNYQPQFHPVRGAVLSEQLRDFLEMSHAVDTDADWKSILRVLKVCKNGMDVVVSGQWNRLLSQLREIRKSGILELMIRHIDHDPDWQLKPKKIEEHIARAYLENRRAEARNAITGCLNAQKNARLYELAGAIFDDPDIKGIRYYTDEYHELYTEKNFEGFIYIKALNYLKIFLFDIFKKDILPLCELLLIRGQWSSVEQSLKMSNSYHELLDICDRLSKFDDSLSEEGTNGAQLHAAITRADRSKIQARIVARTLRFVNGQALDLINTSAQALIVIGQILKNAYEDYPRDFHEYILNWEDLEPMAEVPVLRRVVNTYKRIYNFIQLMHSLTRQTIKPGLAEEATAS